MYEQLMAEHTYSPTSCGCLTWIAEDRFEQTIVRWSESGVRETLSVRYLQTQCTSNNKWERTGGGCG